MAWQKRGLRPAERSRDPHRVEKGTDGPGLPGGAEAPIKGHSPTVEKAESGDSEDWIQSQ